MLNQAFSSLYADSTALVGNATAKEYLLCCAASVILGIIAALIYSFRHKASKNFLVTLALLPLIVQTVITLVNGNLGAGVAVMGVFSLVRFRSIPGSAKDIASVFLSMAIGLATGMGYLGLAVLFTVIVALANIILTLSPLGKSEARPLALKISVPEDLEFNGMFDSILSRYTTCFDLVKVQTTNMGSLFQLEYNVWLRDMSESKKMIDEIRCLNGNLKIALCHVEEQECL